MQIHGFVPASFRLARLVMRAGFLKRAGTTKKFLGLRVVISLFLGMIVPFSGVLLVGYRQMAVIRAWRASGAFFLFSARNHIPGDEKSLVARLCVWKIKRNWPEGQHLTDKAVNSPHPVAAEATHAEAVLPNVQPVTGMLARTLHPSTGGTGGMLYNGLVESR